MIKDSPKRILLNKKYLSLNMDTDSNTPATSFSGSDLIDMGELDDFIELSLTCQSSTFKVMEEGITCYLHK